jgi:hypothetical protein
MATTDKDDGSTEANQVSKPAWLLFLEEEFPELDADAQPATAGEAHHFEFDCIIAAVIKQFLLSEEPNAPATFAKRFDDLYETVYLPRYNGHRVNKKG